MSREYNFRNLILSFFGLIAYVCFVAMFFRQVNLFHVYQPIRFLYIIIAATLILSAFFFYTTVTILLSCNVCKSSNEKKCRDRAGKHFIFGIFGIVTGGILVIAILYIQVLTCVQIDGNGYLNFSENIDCIGDIHNLWGDIGGLLVLFTSILQAFLFPYYVFYSIRVFA